MTDTRFVAALRADDSLPMAARAREHWLRDMQNPMRHGVLPALNLIQSLSLHTIYFLKRLSPLQFSAHRLLQRTICFFMKWFVSPDANYLILRHMWIESRILNFVILNSRAADRVARVEMYPEMIRDLLRHDFVTHDRELFRVVAELGETADEDWPPTTVDFSAIEPVEFRYDPGRRKLTQILDFETAHELFKVTFCLLLRSDEYEAAINSLNFDQSLCLRVGRILGLADVAALAHNAFPLVLHDTRRLSQRFVLHGVCMEHLFALLEREAARASMRARAT